VIRVKDATLIVLCPHCGQWTGFKGINVEDGRVLKTVCASCGRPYSIVIDVQAEKSPPTEIGGLPLPDGG
jgi:DNA-directed RNA polymerase subunit RPC12/RpoP